MRLSMKKTISAFLLISLSLASLNSLAMNLSEDEKVNKNHTEIQNNTNSMQSNKRKKLLNQAVYKINESPNLKGIVATTCLITAYVPTSWVVKKILRSPHLSNIKKEVLSVSTIFTGLIALGVSLDFIDAIFRRCDFTDECNFARTCDFKCNTDLKDEELLSNQTQSV